MPFEAAGRLFWAGVTHCWKIGCESIIAEENIVFGALPQNYWRFPLHYCRKSSTKKIAG
jgi:hypothetical protein